jgi:hypothetical protein
MRDRKLRRRDDSDDDYSSEPIQAPKKVAGKAQSGEDEWGKRGAGERGMKRVR